MRLDDAIAGFVAAGLDAIEVWHSDHDAAASAHYRQLARAAGLGKSGGSDFHGDESHHAAGLGAVMLPAAAFADSKRAPAAARPADSLTTDVAARGRPVLEIGGVEKHYRRCGRSACRR